MTRYSHETVSERARNRGIAFDEEPASITKVQWMVIRHFIDRCGISYSQMVDAATGRFIEIDNLTQDEASRVIEAGNAIHRDNPRYNKRNDKSVLPKDNPNTTFKRRE